MIEIIFLLWCSLGCTAYLSICDWTPTAYWGPSITLPHKLWKLLLLIAICGPLVWLGWIFLLTGKALRFCFRDIGDSIMIFFHR